MIPRPLAAPAIALLLLLAAALPAEAHRLRLFASVTGDTVSGYAFFVGGGRPAGATLRVRDATGALVATLTTDAAGGFAFTPPVPGALTLSVDAGDGHGADLTLGADRFARPAPPPVAGPPSPATPAAAIPGDADRLDAIVAQAVERAIRPLLEAQAEAEARIRFNDVMGGIGMIVGLTGIGLWASVRRRDRHPPPDPP